MVASPLELVERVETTALDLAQACGRQGEEDPRRLTAHSDFAEALTTLKMWMSVHGHVAPGPAISPSSGPVPLPKRDRKPGDEVRLVHSDVEGRACGVSVLIVEPGAQTARCIGCGAVAQWTLNGWDVVGHGSEHVEEF